MAMTYDQLNTYLQTILPDQGPSTDYTTILPAAIQYAEQRIYRDMDFVATRTVDSPTNFVAGSREFTLPTSAHTILVVQGVSAMTPVGSTTTNGKQNILEQASLDYIDSTWPDVTLQGVPDTWAMKNDAVIVVKPTPDQNYNAAITGTFRPTAMSATNETTYIGNVYPDLLIAACMIFLAGYQKNYGAQGDDPRQAMSWETQYGIQLKNALSEEQRRKGQGVGWVPFSPAPEAQPPRT
jgi:hypothetical protein